MNAYSKAELQEFKNLILKKIESSRQEYNNLSKHLEDNSTKDTDPIWQNANYASEAASIEEINYNATRLKKFIESLTAALTRIENGTYGVCNKTGTLIPKERLMAVPHATLCIDAKLNQ